MTWSVSQQSTTSCAPGSVSTCTTLQRISLGHGLEGSCSGLSTTAPASVRLCVRVVQEAILYAYDLSTVPSILPAFANKRDLIICDEVRHELPHASRPHPCQPLRTDWH